MADAARVLETYVTDVERAIACLVDGAQYVCNVVVAWFVWYFRYQARDVHYCSTIMDCAF